MSNEDKYQTMKWNGESAHRQTQSGQGAQQRRSASSSSNSTRKKRKRRSRLLGFVLWLVLVVGASMIFAEVGWLLANDFCAFNKEPLTATIEVTKEDDLDSVADKLKESGLIEYKWFFKLFAKISHAEDKIGVGVYELDTELDYKSLITGMRNRDATLNAQVVKVSIPEGYSVRQIISLLAKNGVSTEEALLDAVENGDFSSYTFLSAKRSGIAKLEGYLFPDTYEFFVDENAEHALCRLLDNFDLKMGDELLEKVTDSGYSLNEIMTIASLIEKETDGHDHANISSVIYNRLNNVGETFHKLEIDASNIYGLGYAKGETFSGPLTQSDLEKDTPYNLRLYEGLPPTPIGNPGLKSIQAALEPAHTSYYFYALGKDKSHHFFRTYAEHVAFVNSDQYGG